MWAGLDILLVRVQKETGERAVFVVVAAVRLAPVQLDINLVPGIKMQDHAVAGVVVVLVGVLGYGAGADLRIKRRELLGHRSEMQTHRSAGKTTKLLRPDLDLVTLR